MRRLHPGPPADVTPLEAYADPPVAAGRPGVRLNFVASLDGAITIDGRSGGLAGDADRRAFRAMRAHADVILVGAGTARAEDYGPPRLPDDHVAARLARGAPALPRLAVVTHSLALDWGARMFAGAGEGARPLVVTHAGAPADARARAGAVADLVVAGDSSVDLGAALRALGERGVESVLCEGGPALSAGLAAAGLVDELCLTVSPRLVGGDARRLLDGPPTDGRAGAMRLHAVLEEDGFLFLRHRRANP